ncbi:hypothetical protein ACHAPO_006239 [Fusarium lateritium]
MEYYDLPVREIRGTDEEEPHTKFWPTTCIKPEHPIPEFGPDEVKKRFQYAKDINAALRRIPESDFKLRVEQFAQILLVRLHHLEPNGYLSPETCSPFDLMNQVESVSPFCKHYMLHLDPENIEHEHKTTNILRHDPENIERWEHAIPKGPERPPDLDPEDMDVEEYAILSFYDTQFTTKETLPEIHSRDIDQEKRCQDRDGNKCVVTGRPNPEVFWFIPFSFNNNVENNNFTGNLQAGCMDLTDIDLLDNVLSVRGLGKSHKAWNMICVDRILCKYLKKGLCAFKYVDRTQLDDGMSKVHLTFYWIPVLYGRFNQVMDIEGDAEENGGHRLVRELEHFHTIDCHPPLSFLFGPDAEIFEDLPQSGQSIFIDMPEEDAVLFESVVTIHWSCIMFTALCGGAGRAWYLTGKDQTNGFLQPRDHVFKHDLSNRSPEDFTFRNTVDLTEILKPSASDPERGSAVETETELNKD